MLVDAQDQPIGPIPEGEHWRLFEALLADARLAAPLRDAINAHLDSVIALHPPGQDVLIDPTGAGPQVFGRVPSQWLADYKQWHDKSSKANPAFQNITSERMYGMMLWYMLAAERPEKWKVPPSNERRVYELIERATAPSKPTADRRMLMEVRDVLRAQLAKIDAILGGN